MTALPKSPVQGMKFVSKIEKRKYERDTRPKIINNHVDKESWGTRANILPVAARRLYCWDRDWETSYPEQDS